MCGGYSKSVWFWCLLGFDVVMIIKKMFYVIDLGFDRFRRSEVSSAIYYSLAYKLAFFLLVYLGFHLLPFSEGSLRANLNYPENAPITFMTALKTWDGQHYHYLAENGYKAGEMSNAFYPLYPILIGALASITGLSAVLAGVLISNFLSIGAAVFLYLLARIYASREQSLAALLLFLSYPVAFYTNILYSESLFLFLVLGLFYGLYKEKLWLSIVFALMLPLSRPQGMLIGLVIGFFYLWKYRGNAHRVFDNKEALIIFAFPYGVVAYFLFMYLSVGSSSAGFDAQKHFISGNSIMNIMNIQDWFIRNFVDIKLQFHGFTDSIIDRLFFGFYVFMLYWVYRKTDLTLTVYSIIIGIIPALSGTFMSYSRYTLVVFPIFIALALISGRHYRFIALLFASIQVVFAISHTLNHWVG